MVRRRNAFDVQLLKHRHTHPRQGSFSGPGGMTDRGKMRANADLEKPGMEDPTDADSRFKARCLDSGIKRPLYLL